MLAALVDRPCSNVRRLAGNRAREVQYHRLLRNKKVSVAEMAEAAGLATGLCVAGRDIAVIQDTSEIAVGGVAEGRAGFGPIGKGGATRGILLHAAIAVDDQGALAGLVDQNIWTREGGKPQTDRRRAFEDKESHRWLATSKAAAARLCGARSITMVADAESDIYEFFARLPEDLHVLVRSARDRRLDNGHLLSQTVAGLAVAGRIERIIPAAPGRKARAAQLDLRFAPIAIKAPQDLPKAAQAGCAGRIDMHVVEVREQDCPKGVEPVSWLLLTSHEVASAARAAELVDLYRGRFLIEQLFRTLKTAGFNIEEAEIGEPEALIAFTAFATLAAVKVLQLVKAREGGNGQAVSDCFEAGDMPLIKALSRKLEGKTEKQKNPHPPNDLAFASWVIARLGGWTGYYGKPGPQIMRYGLERFHAIKLGTEIAKDV